MKEMLRLLSMFTAMQLSQGQGTQFLDGYLGCWQDNGNRDFKKDWGNGYGIESCRKKAAQSKLKFFALQNGQQCFGGNTYGKYDPKGADSECAAKDYRKKEDSKERMLFYGGAWTNAVYYTKEQWFTPQKKNAMAAKGNFLGCYWDNGDREYDDEFKDAKNKKVEYTHVDSVEACAKLAETNKMPYFALQVGRECRMSKKMFNKYYMYPPVLGNSACAKSAPEKASKGWPNFGGAGWMNAIYYTKKSPYYPGAFWESPDGDDSIRLAWANAYCLNIQFAKFQAGQNLMAYRCVDSQGKVADNMQFIVADGLIKSKKDPKLCISYKGAKLETSKQITLETCGAKGTFQKIQLYDDMTIRFTDSSEYGFNIWKGIGGGNGLNNRMLKTYKVTAANNEAFLIRTPVPPTPKPTPVPTPSPPMKGLKKAMGWTISKGKCTIDITTGTPCAVSPNFPKPYSDEDSCKVKMTKTKAVKPETFETEKYFDNVKIGDEVLNGKLVKTPTMNLEKGVDTIEWSSDFYLGTKGWKICKTKFKQPDLPKVEKKPKIKVVEKKPKERKNKLAKEPKKLNR